MRRLEEVLRQMCSAAKAIGNTELENKFAEGEKLEVHYCCTHYQLYGKQVYSSYLIRN